VVAPPGLFRSVETIFPRGLGAYVIPPDEGGVAFEQLSSLDLAYFGA
jgi:hypothetical protein